MDTKSLISYNINYNENVEVVVMTKKVDDEKDINVVWENDQDE